MQEHLVTLKTCIRPVLLVRCYKFITFNGVLLTEREGLLQEPYTVLSRQFVLFVNTLQSTLAFLISVETYGIGHFIFFTSLPRAI